MPHDELTFVSAHLEEIFPISIDDWELEACRQLSLRKSKASSIR